MILDKIQSALRYIKKNKMIKLAIILTICGALEIYVKSTPNPADDSWPDSVQNVLTTFLASNDDLEDPTLYIE